jgi:hypothetical protein
MADRMYWPYGELKELAHTGADETEKTFSVRPPAGQEWLIIVAYNLHDDGAGAHAMIWNLFDGSTNLVLINRSQTSGGFNFLASTSEGEMILAPLKINHDTYLISQVDALAAGKKLTTNLAYYESVSDRDV